MQKENTPTEGIGSDQTESESALRDAACSRLVLQRRYLPSYGIPKPWTEWHDHPEPHQIAWGPGQCASLEENIRRACRDYYELGKGIEYRMLRRTDETVWEYSSANVKHIRDDG